MEQETLDDILGPSSISLHSSFKLGSEFTPVDWNRSPVGVLVRHRRGHDDQFIQSQNGSGALLQSTVWNLLLKTSWSILAFVSFDDVFRLVLEACRDSLTSRSDAVAAAIKVYAFYCKHVVISSASATFVPFKALQ